MRQRIASWLVRSFVPRVFPWINPFVTFLLGSRLHWIASWYVVLLEIEGRRTGRKYEIPIAYHRDPIGRIECLTSSSGTWWKNLRGVNEISIVLRGRNRFAYVELVENDGEVKMQALGRRDICRRVLTPVVPSEAILIRLTLGNSL